MMISNRNRRRSRIAASDEIDDVNATTDVDDTAEGGVDVAPEATDLLFEAEDVAELVAEVTGEAVEVTADEDTVTFAIGEAEYTVEAEGNEEILESVRRPMRGKRTVAASTRRTPAARRRTVSASTQTRRTARTVRKVPSSRR